MTTTPTEARVSADELHRFAVDVLVRAGMDDEDAVICADAMVWSDLRGEPAHGVTGRLGWAADSLLRGETCPRPAWIVVEESDAGVVLDADGGWGQVAGTRGMRLATARARMQGVAVALVRNASITAALGRYAAVAVEERMIGMAINDTLPVIAPTGGTAKLLGNQAFAVGVPARRHPPILFDTALAALSLTAISALRDRGQTLPPGLAVDERGRPTVDPDKALVGTIAAAGDHWGYGLALMWEVLTGVLGGGLMAPDVGRDATVGRPMGVTLFCLAIDPTTVMPYEAFTARVDALVEHIHAATPMPGVEQVRVPGQRGHRLAATRRREGVPVSAERSARLGEIGRRVGVPWPPPATTPSSRTPCWP